jgi:hypothetical protein
MTYVFQSLVQGQATSASTSVISDRNNLIPLDIANGGFPVT